jgi:nucleotide-binding universal stress UspA family protein
MADHLLRTSQVPLLLLHLDQEEEPSYQADEGMSRVLIPLDGSELAESAIAGARRLLGDDIEITLMRVVQYPYHFVSPYLPDTIQGNQDLFKQATAHAKDYLTEMAWKLKDSVAQVHTEVSVSEHPAQAVVDFAESHDFEVIAMATHGRGGFGRLALGSIADKVIRTTRVPVLTFRPDEKHAVENPAPVMVSL